MTIIEQCEKCERDGKNVYCNNCKKSIDYFYVYEYKNHNNRFNDGQMIGKIRAYTWHDAIEYIKNNFFNDQKNLNINCEREFAYIEKKLQADPLKIVYNNKDHMAFKLYLNKERKNESKSNSLNDDIIWDITI
jgi:hypothetical protein